MYRKEVNERSPMRVFEESIHGGLGRGNVGVVAAGPGVGKTPILVQIALDELLRDRRVLHISHEHAVDHVRAYYGEIFHDLSVTSKLDEPEQVSLELERHRLILSLRQESGAPPASERGGRTSISKTLDAVAFARDVAQFEPDMIIIDGIDLEHATDDALSVLVDLARERNVELWLSVRTEAMPAGARELPEPLARFASSLAVVLFLRPERDVVRLRILKDHNNDSVADLHLRLDPHTMRIIDEDVRPTSDRPRDPRRYRLVSGGGKGAEAEFGACAERWGMPELNFSFEGHRLLERNRGIVVLGEQDLKKGDFSLVYVSKRLNRLLSEIPLIRNVLQTIWHQINNASQVFVVGIIQEDGTVRGGTGWGAELARLWKKPLFVFDQNRRSWFRWNGSAWEIASQPVITSDAFAGIGTQRLSEDGRAAIVDLFVRTFGEPPAKAS
jgi:hypothetical protein